MSGQVPVVLPVGGAGALILPHTSAPRTLFYAAIALLAVGVVALLASVLAAQKASKAEAK